MDSTQLREQAENKLINIIVKHLKTGEKFPTETKLIEDLGISRTMLRELLSYYEASGIITSQRGSGRFVNMPNISFQLVHSWRILVRARPELLMDFLEIRYILEINTLPQAIQSIKFDGLIYMNEQVRLMKEKAARGENFVDEYSNFHRILFESTNNPLMEQLLISLSSWSLFDDAGIQRSHEDLIALADLHEKMLEAFTRKDRELSLKLMEEQFADTRLQITRFLAESR